MKVRILGCGNSRVRKHLHPTCILLEHNKEYILLDCGPSTYDQFVHYDLDISRVRTILHTHFHPDHFAGSLSIAIEHTHMEIDPRLVLHGPKSLQERWSGVCNAYGATRALDYVEVREFDNDGFTELYLSDLRIRSFRVYHTDDQMCVGYTVEKVSSGGRVVFTGDTGRELHPAFQRSIQNAHLLIIDAAATDEGNHRHLTPDLAAYIGRESDAHVTVLTHLPGSEHHRSLLEAAVQKYNSPRNRVEIAEEGKEYILP